MPYVLNPPLPPSTTPTDFHSHFSTVPTGVHPQFSTVSTGLQPPVSVAPHGYHPPPTVLISAGFEVQCLRAN